MKKVWIPLAIALLTSTLGASGFLAWRARVIHRQIALREQAIRKALAENHGAEALAVVDDLRHVALGRSTPAQREEWRAWELQASVEAREMRRLLALYERAPAEVAANEEASLLTARGLTAANRPQAAAALREGWRGREQQKASWLFYDADVFLRSGLPEAAKALLAGVKFSGTEEANRCLRLALISLRTPEEAFRYVQAAYAADPQNADVRTFRAEMLERREQYGLAKAEYTAAVAAQPANPILRTQLAEFYLRRHQYPLAVEAFTEGGSLAGGNFLHNRALFWSLVATGLTPVPAEAQAKQPPLAQMLAALPTTEFWDDALFARMCPGRTEELNTQEVFWLRILQNLKSGQESRAAESLRSSPFRTASFEPEVEQALTVVLQYRLQGTVPAAEAISPALEGRHLFLQQLAAWGRGQKTPGLEEFVAGPHALPALLLACGWREAALRALPGVETLPGTPEWYRFGLVQALRVNRSPEAALALVKAQPATPLMLMLKGELLLALKQEGAATEALRAAAHDPSEAGLRAAWMLATWQLQQNDLTGARATVEAQPRLVGDTLGQELLARTTALERHAEEAAARYAAVADRSVEAKSFLARHAMETHQWGEARKWTEQLLAQFPEEEGLRRNLAAIEQAAP